jgi:uncharacterized protein YecE (DUF72 family)
MSELVYGVQVVPDYLVGAGGWAYFKVPGESSLKAYSKVFNFVEVNYTFYEYPSVERVKRWRELVPEEFTFAVRCHQDLTHRIGLKPVNEAYFVFSKMVSYCNILDAPFLVLETPARYVFGQQEVDRARDFFSSANQCGVRLVWEIRAPISRAVVDLMQDFNIVHCTDLSKEKPSYCSDVVYSRLFGKGKHNLYQFSDEELADIKKNAADAKPKVAALSYHGARMYSDAARFLQYEKTGEFLPVTSFVCADSVREVLEEDAVFPASKSALIEDQGWKVVDLSLDKRVHLSELLTKIPNSVYECVEEVVVALEGYL